MNVKLHTNARSTPRVREIIKSSDKSARALAEEFGVSETTIYRWRNRNGTYVDHSPRRPRPSGSQYQLVS